MMSAAENFPSCWNQTTVIYWLCCRGLNACIGPSQVRGGGGLTELGHCVSLPLMACHNVKSVEPKLGFG